jgi:hypothetical protein
MRSVTLALLILSGGSFCSTEAWAFFPHQGALRQAVVSKATNKLATFEYVKVKKPKKKQNNYSEKNYIPGHVRTPYGYADCIGWWERHPDGRMQCHGQLIRDR